MPGAESPKLVPLSGGGVIKMNPQGRNTFPYQSVNEESLSLFLLKANSMHEREEGRSLPRRGEGDPQASFVIVEVEAKHIPVLCVTVVP
jgi:hypothetical protein